MSEPIWAKVDDFFNQALIGDEPILTQALAAGRDAGLPAIDVAANQGKMLHLMALMVGAERI